MIYRTLYHTLDELPIYNWVEFNKTGNKSLLVKKPGVLWPRDTDAVIDTLMDSYYKAYGKTPEFIQYLKDLKDLTMMQCDNILLPDAATEIYIIDAQNRIKTRGQAVEDDFNTQVAAVSKFMGGMYIDTRVVTVTEFYGYIKLMEKTAQNLKKKPQDNKT